MVWVLGIALGVMSFASGIILHLPQRESKPFVSGLAGGTPLGALVVLILVWIDAGFLVAMVVFVLAFLVAGGFGSVVGGFIYGQEDGQ